MFTLTVGYLDSLNSLGQIYFRMSGDNSLWKSVGIKYSFFRYKFTLLIKTLLSMKNTQCSTYMPNKPHLNKFSFMLHEQNKIWH